MLYELRVYYVNPGKMKPLQDRFANVALHYMKKHGIKPLLFMEAVIGTSNQLTYILEWESLAQREKCFTAFMGDPGWLAARAESEKDGAFLVRTNNTILSEVPSIMATLRKLRES